MNIEQYTLRNMIVYFWSFFYYINIPPASRFWHLGDIWLQGGLGTHSVVMWAVWHISDLMGST